MSKQQIKIDSLEIRLRNISPEVARAAVNGLGQTLLDQLSSPRELLGGKRTVNIGRIKPDTLRVANGARPNELQSALGKGIATAIRSKLK
jgi:hypothetical protein